MSLRSAAAGSLGPLAATALAGALGWMAHAQLEPLRAGRAALSAKASPLYLPSPHVVELVALGHRSTVADLYYLWAIQHFSGPMNAERRAWLRRVFDTITDLDPRFRDAYWLGFVSLLDEARDRDAAFALVDKALQNDPGYALIAMEAAMAAHQLGDEKRAIRYLRLAAERTSDPTAQRLMLKITVLETTQEELREWQGLLSSVDEHTRAVARSHVRDLRVAIDLERLHALVSCYRSEHGRAPASLEDLLAAGYVSEVPLDPEGRDYLYEPETGSLRSRKRFRNVPPTRARLGVDLSDLGRCAPGAEATPAP